MDDVSRRAMLAGGLGFAGAAALAACGSSKAEAPPVAAKQAHGLYAWAVNTKGLVVPHATWTKMTYDQTLLNTTSAHLDSDGATWIFPTATASGIWGVLLNVAWDNAVSPKGERIAPKTHRKLARFLQQNVGTPQIGQEAITGASGDLTYHADLAQLGDQGHLSDGSKGYQQQQVNIQLGVQRSGPAQRTWFEVYQDSGQSLVCRFDGSRVPQTGDRPRLSGLQAPSLMIAKMCDF
jgi:hypothetical protein